MIKKLIIMGILMIPFLLLTRMATAQNYETIPAYEEMPEEVQIQMDANKASALATYTNIVVTFVVEVNGLEESEFEELKSRAANLSQINSIKIVGSKVTIVMDGAYPFVSVKRIFSDLVTSLGNINGVYSVKK